MFFSIPGALSPSLQMLVNDAIADMQVCLFPENSDQRAEPVTEPSHVFCGIVGERGSAAA